MFSEKYDERAKNSLFFGQYKFLLLMNGFGNFFELFEAFLKNRDTLRYNKTLFSKDAKLFAHEKCVGAKSQSIPMKIIISKNSKF